MNRFNRRSIRLAFFASTLMCALSACSRPQADSTQSASPPIIKTIERGPITMTVSVPRNEITVGEKLPLTINVLAESGVAVIMPQVKEMLGAFEAGNPQTPPDIPDNDKRRWTHTYDLRTLEAGEMEMPAVTIKFTDARQSQPGEAAAVDSELSTEPFTITVKTLMAGDFDPTSFRDIKGAVEIDLPHRARSWLFGIAGLVAFGLAAIFWLLFKRRRVHRAAPPPPLPPHIWALQQLDQLALENLPSRGEFHAFFYRLSLIIRQYIERRFGIMAAEQTTEEFLREARQSSVLNDDQRALLSRFLRLADMVKFARLQPQPGESEEVFASARNFVQQTAPRAEAPSLPVTSRPPPIRTEEEVAA